MKKLRGIIIGLLVVVGGLFANDTIFDNAKMKDAKYFLDGMTLQCMLTYQHYASSDIYAMLDDPRAKVTYRGGGVMKVSYRGEVYYFFTNSNVCNQALSSITN